MDLDDLIRRYFATDRMEDVTPNLLAAGTERLLVDFGLERDRSKRFALWSLLYLLGSAPALDIAFEEEADREAARNFMDLFDAAGPA
jgi:hypothetical protein